MAKASTKAMILQASVLSSNIGNRSAIAEGCIRIAKQVATGKALSEGDVEGREVARPK
jgi:hypothetical protein